MAATQTVSQLSQSYNSLTPRHGVVTLFGYGIQVRVDRGHLLLEDGIGPDRRQARFPRVGHGLRRLVVIGSDGTVSLAALRWLADQDAAFVMLNRDGSVLATTGPVRSSDAKLRRAQALAHSSGAALRITRELIKLKLAGQEQVAGNKLLDASTAQTIARLRSEVDTADTISTVRLLESQAASAYWSAWSNLPINFPRNALPRVPDHWRTFGSRHSPLTGSPRFAANPPNAILNYLYAVLESESQLAVGTMGLDPGLGVLHVDTSARDSLACDVMEPVRPQVDAYLLGWIARESLSRDWFFEQRDGNCRLMAPFAVRLSETAPTWGRAVAPIAEWVAHAFWLTIRRPDSQLATRLTQRQKREAKGSTITPAVPAPGPQSICQGCGKIIASGSANCAVCAVGVSRQRMSDVARLGRAASKTPSARARVSATQRHQAAARYGWSPSNQPDWLMERVYTEKVKPHLASASISEIARALDVSYPYAAAIRAGRRRPHPRHWQVLSELVGVTNR